MLGHLGLSNVHAEDSAAVAVPGPGWLASEPAELNDVKKEAVLLTIFAFLWPLRDCLEEPQRSVYVSSSG